MSRIVLRSFAVAVVTVILVAVLAHPLWRRLDAGLNRVAGERSPASVSAGAAELHRRLWIADLHCDATLWDRGLLVSSAAGHVDLPRLRQGGVALQVFSFPNRYPLGSNYRRTPSSVDLLGAAAFANGWPRSTWTSPLSRALFQARMVHDAAAASGGGLAVITTAADLSARAGDDGSTRPVGAVLAVEGMHVRRGDLAAVDALFAAGVRVFGIVHMSDNTVAGSAHGWRKHGLSDFGRQVVARIDSLGGIVDLAHASETTIDDVLASSARSLLVSHTGVDGTCPGERNLSDEHLRRIGRRGGLIGIGFWHGAVCGEDAADIARAVRHARTVAGTDAVALGSDFDGAVRTPFDAAGLALLTEALLAEGLDAHDVARVMGLNALEFFLRSLPAE